MVFYAFRTYPMVAAIWSNDKVWRDSGYVVDCPGYYRMRV